MSITRSISNSGGRCGRMRRMRAMSKLTPRAVSAGASLGFECWGFGVVCARLTASLTRIVSLDEKIREVVVGRHVDHTALAALQHQAVTFGLTDVAHDALHALDDLFGQLALFGLQLTLKLHVGALELAEGFLVLFEFLREHVARQHVALLLEA